MNSRDGTTPKVLFLGHDAGRTGAPILLLHFLRWLAENTEIRFEILLRREGPLVPEYRAIAPTQLLRHRRQPPFRARLARLVFGRDSPRWAGAHLPRLYPREEYPLIYANTVANADLIGHFGQRGHRIICHAHEMRFGIEQWGGADAARTSNYIRRIIAASEPVMNDIAQTWNFDRRKIEVIGEFGRPMLNPERVPLARTRIREALHVSPTDILVGMCGTLDWRKGSDAFLQLASMLHLSNAPTRYGFVWIGAAACALQQRQFDHDVERLGLTGRVTLTGDVERAEEYLSACDVFALTSREDPCPLAMLEAAALGLPVVCFADSGGAEHFVDGGAGVAVPYLNCRSMADAVALLAADESLRRKIGTIGRTKAERAYSLRSQAPKLLAVVREELNAAISEPSVVPIPVPV